MNEDKDIFISPIKKLITKKDKLWSSLIKYHPIIPIINGLPKTHKPRFYD